MAQLPGDVAFPVPVQRHDDDLRGAVDGYISLRGNRHAGRVGASILHHSGLTGWIAASEADYIALATASAADRPALTGLRATIIEQVRASELTNQARFTTEMERAYRRMWGAWCESAVP
jgi:predicted O-linked N-acetylglucosamine transferase (SPINDLY family)